MKKIILILILLLSCSLFAKTPKHNFAAGVILGEPTGLSFKKWNNSVNAIDFGLAWSLGNEAHLSIHSDFLFHKIHITSGKNNFIPLYLGIGARAKLQDDSKIGIRFPFGIDYFFKSAPLDIFFELVPVFDILPETSFDFGAGIGIRYNFSIK